MPGNNFRGLSSMRIHHLSVVLLAVPLMAAQCPQPPPGNDGGTHEKVLLEPPPAGQGFQLTTPAFDVAAGNEIQDCYFFQVPGQRHALEALPGVGRKTASVVLANAFGVPALAVDTHVGRLARRMGLTTQQDPRKVEDDLCALWPREAWVDAHHALILHGRRVCSARAPDCARCAVLPHCPQKGL